MEILVPALKRAKKIDIGRAAYQASAAIPDHGKQPLIDPATVSYAAEQVLDDWFPD